MSLSGFDIRAIVVIAIMVKKFLIFFPSFYILRNNLTSIGTRCFQCLVEFFTESIRLCAFCRQAGLIPGSISLDVVSLFNSFFLFSFGEPCISFRFSSLVEYNFF